jgi:hypothetical protein
MLEFDRSSAMPFPFIASKKKKFMIGSPLLDSALITTCPKIPPMMEQTGGNSLPVTNLSKDTSLSR